MLIIAVQKPEHYDNEKEEFVYFPSTMLALEHSLVSLSKWESKYKKPFLSDGEKSDEETIDYIRMMCLSPDVSPEVYGDLSQENHDAIAEYIQDKMTATWFGESKTNPFRKEIITAEVIYYWMVAHTIPFECQHWHLNRLLTLIRVCNEKNKQADPKKTNPQDLAASRRKLNEERRAKLGTTG